MLLLKPNRTQRSTCARFRVFNDEDDTNPRTRQHQRSLSERMRKRTRTSRQIVGDMLMELAPSEKEPTLITYEPMPRTYNTTPRPEPIDTFAEFSELMDAESVIDLTDARRALGTNFRELSIV